MLQRILDKVLSPQPAASRPMTFMTDAMHINDSNNESIRPTTQQQQPQIGPTTQMASTLEMSLDHQQNPMTAITANDDPTIPGLLDFSWMDNWNAGFEADFWMNLPDHPLLSLDGS